MPTQVEEFLDKATPLVTPPEAQPTPAPNAPRVPFQSNLKLTGDQEKRMIDHAFKRFRELKNELGRDVSMNPQWWQGLSGAANLSLATQGFQGNDTFLGKRTRFDATFLNDVSWRPWTMGTDNIFMYSNFAVPVVRRVCRQMIARAKNSFFGSDPWFSIDPAPVPERDAQPDAERADRIEKFCQFKLRESDSKSDKERAIARALILGEAAVKTSYVVRDQIFNIEAEVLHGVDGQPMYAADGNVITREDQFVDHVDEVGNQKRVLARDLTTEEPLAPIWQSAPLDRRQILFEGAKSEVIYYKDFLCPLTAANVQEADCVIHLYDRPVMAFVDLVVKRGMVGDGTPERMEAARKMVALVKELANNSPQPKAAVSSENRPNDHFATVPSVETGGPVAEFMEVYLWFDVFGDGVQRNICLIVDRNTQAPIFYDFVAAITSDGLRPIEIIRVNPVEGRWYGLGIMEMMEPYGDQISLLVNRWNFSQSRSGRVDFWRPTDTLEGDNQPDLQMNYGKTYTVKPSADPDKVLVTKYLNDIKFDQIERMFQFFLQLLMNESGVANANDGRTAGQQSDELATGILETAKSGDELFRPIIQDLHGPLQNLVTREIDVTLANMNPVEVFTYLEGDTMGVDQLTADDVRGLKYKVRITLSTHRTQEKIQMAAQVCALVEKFYSLPPPVQMRTQQFYKAQIRGLDPTVDVDTVIVPLSPLEAMAGGADGAAPGEGAPNTPFQAQLGQKTNQPKGVSAPGGTQAA